MTVEDYIKQKYSKTKWPFFAFIELCNKFGLKETKKQLNKLASESKVRKRKYINGVLVEYLTT